MLFTFAIWRSSNENKTGSRKAVDDAVQHIQKNDKRKKTEISEIENATLFLQKAPSPPPPPSATQLKRILFSHCSLPNFSYATLRFLADNHHTPSYCTVPCDTFQCETHTW